MQKLSTRWPLAAIAGHKIRTRLQKGNRQAEQPLQIEQPVSPPLPLPPLPPLPPPPPHRPPFGCHAPLGSVIRHSAQLDALCVEAAARCSASQEDEALLSKMVALQRERRAEAEAVARKCSRAGEGAGVQCSRPPMQGTRCEMGLGRAGGQQKCAAGAATVGGLQHRHCRRFAATHCAYDVTCLPVRAETLKAALLSGSGWLPAAIVLDASLIAAALIAGMIA